MRRWTINRRVITLVDVLNHQPLWRNSTIVFGILYIKTATTSSGAFLHTERDLLEWKRSPSSSVGLRLDLCLWNDTDERSQFQQGADRFWTTAGMKWLVVRTMSQASCAELARNGGGVLNGFILHFYGQCGFAYEGNKQKSVSSLHLRLMMTSVSWNLLVYFIKWYTTQMLHNPWPQSLYFYKAIFEKALVFEIESGQNRNAG